MTYTAITDGEIDGESPMTATLYTLLRDNPIAIAAGDPGAPSIVEAAMATASINQAALKSAQAENTTTIEIIGVDLTGGEYAFLLELKNSTGATGTYAYGSTIGGTNENVSTTSTSYVTRMMFGENGSTTASIRHRYIQASPPYDLGDGEIGLFIYLTIDKWTKEILATSIAPDAPWHYGGPTIIRPHRIDGATGRKYRNMLVDINGNPIVNVEDKIKAAISGADYKEINDIKKSIRALDAAEREQMLSALHQIGDKAGIVIRGIINDASIHKKDAIKLITAVNKKSDKTKTVALDKIKKQTIKAKAKAVEEIIAGRNGPVYTEVELTQKIINADMDLRPTNNTVLFENGKDITSNTITVLLDPVCDLSHTLKCMCDHGEFSLGDLLHGDYFKIDTTKSNLIGPKVVPVHKFNWKNNK